MSLGFTPNLLCSSCDELQQFKLEALLDPCKGCCHADQSETMVEKVSLNNLAMSLDVYYVFLMGKYCLHTYINKYFKY